jgi:hypothetical protein
MKPTQQELLALLSYNSLTGIVTWKASGKGRSGSLIAGTKDSRGYINITIDGNIYGIHCVIWCMLHGYWSEQFIDHKDRNPSNNKEYNLREISNQCNVRNSGLYSSNTSKVTGVTKNKRGWQVSICVSQKRYYLGRSNCFLEAVAHRLAAEQCLNWSDCNSDSPAYTYVKEHIPCVR